MSHTPGPWTANGLAIESSDMPLAHLYDESDGFDIPMADAKANALLMATAPELLKALIEITHQYVVRMPQLVVGEIAEPALKARAAIAKATGGAQ